MVERVDIQSVLQQMRQVKDHLRTQQQMVQPLAGQDIARIREARLEQQVKALASVDSVRGDNSIPNFQTMFKTAIDNVNDKQKIASDLATRFEQGDPRIDLPEVMIAMQKSSVSFQAMTQVRNKLIEAYKDIMNMPV